VSGSGAIFAFFSLIALIVGVIGAYFLLIGMSIGGVASNAYLGVVLIIAAAAIEAFGVIFSK
jgi:hypothetical protein